MKKNVDFMWVDWGNKLIDLRTQYVSQKVLPKRQLPRWITKNIRLSIKKRNKLHVWQKFVDYPTLESEAKYKKLRNKITSNIRVAKSNYESQIADKIKKDPKSFYSYVRAKSKIKSKIGPKLEKTESLFVITKACAIY
jgi:hypothetical protein